MTREERGSVTAETAVLLPALAFVFALLLSGARAVSGQLAVQDAARIGARAAARGESASEVVRLARAAAPTGSLVTSAADGDLVRVEVSAVVRPIGWFPAFTVRGSAVAAAEPVAAQ